ncbi:hypothetical protein GLOTRDRAFT_96995 [Gloeophyllum trabeum ATCC 11539]|uniref:Uncharacterized protein n=1 Tax=Gloeophyllum trabeum (strain ATCC 11539 / FP-39264 / Madison 617) TaxID=670483 RepID=S7RDM8_GLOTA|nr:uncharacterized protein GLOTRDRAFT_96995 [Gloeophyllum trabeum ATCC 11539]EPQ50529.1 hypothetical protein GLOTRDRAFT_96995 [Gloeophyllum trabeum ATCC 11539]
MQGSGRRSTSWPPSATPQTTSRGLALAENTNEWGFLSTRRWQVQLHAATSGMPSVVGDPYRQPASVATRPSVDGVQYGFLAPMSKTYSAAHAESGSVGGRHKRRLPPVLSESSTSSPKCPLRRCATAKTLESLRSPQPVRPNVEDESDKRLRDLGYKSEFRREMSLFGVLGISFCAVGICLVSSCTPRSRGFQLPGKFQSAARNAPNTTPLTVHYESMPATAP